MTYAIKDFVDSEPFFESHDHQKCLSDYDWSNINFQEFLGYVPADILVANGMINDFDFENNDEFFRLWPMVRTTGYGSAVELGIEEFCNLKLTLENVPEINAEAWNQH